MRVIVADSLQKCNLAGDNSINAIPRIVGAVVDTDIYIYIYRVERVQGWGANYGPAAESSAIDGYNGNLMAV